MEGKQPPLIQDDFETSAFLLGACDAMRDLMLVNVSDLLDHAMAIDLNIESLNI